MHTHYTLHRYENEKQQRKGGNFPSKTIIKTIRCILISVRNTKLLLLQHNMNNLVYERQFPLPSNDTRDPVHASFQFGDRVLNHDR